MLTRKNGTVPGREDGGSKVASSLKQNAGGIAEGTEPIVDVHGPYGEVVLVALDELGQGAGHGQGQSAHIAHLLPVRGGWWRTCLLVCIQLVSLNPSVQRVEGHIPGQH